VAVFFLRGTAAGCGRASVTKAKRAMRKFPKGRRLEEMTASQRRAWVALWLKRRGVLAEPALTLLDDLAAYWPLDESGGTRYDATLSDADLIEDVRAVPGPAIVPSAMGKIGDCALFADMWDENTGLGQMDLVSATALPFSAAGDFSFSLWVYSDYGNYSGQWPLCKDNEFIGWFNVEAGNFGVTFYNDGYAAPIGQPATSAGIVPASEWVHLACTKAGSAIKLYVNGVERGSATLTGVITDIGGAWRVGGGEFGYQVNGYVDEVGIWQRTLSAAEVSQLYNSGDGLAYELF